jgi:hypothetical protein
MSENESTAARAPFQVLQLKGMLEGTREDDLVLGFIDLCGTKAHVAEFIRNNGGNQHVLTRLQTSFSSALANVAKESPELLVTQASDGAFLIGNAEAVLKGIIKTMLYAPFFFFDYKRMSFIPNQTRKRHRLGGNDSAQGVTVYLGIS